MMQKKTRAVLLTLGLGVSNGLGCNGFVGDNATAIVEGGPIGRGERDTSHYILAEFDASARGRDHGVTFSRAYMVGYDPENAAMYNHRDVLIPATNEDKDPVIGIFGSGIAYSMPDGGTLNGDAQNAGFTGSVRESSTRSTSYSDSLGVGELGWFDATEGLGTAPEHFGSIEFEVGQKAKGNSPSKEAPSVVRAIDYQYNAGSGTDPDTLSITLKNLGDTKVYINNVQYIVLDDVDRPLYFTFINIAEYLDAGKTLEAVDNEFLFYGTGVKLWTAVWMSTEVFTE